MYNRVIVGVLFVGSFFGCSKEDETPKIESEIEAISITTSQATLIDDGTLKSTDYDEIGFVYSDNPEVTELTGNVILSECTNCTNSYAVAKDLSPSTQYYFKQYGKNGDKYVLGDEYSFSTYSPKSMVLRAGNETDIDSRPSIHSNYWSSFEISDGKIFSFGGANVQDTYIKEVWKYELIFDKWSKVTSSPEELWGNPGTFTENDDIYVITTPYDQANKVFKYSTSSNSWSAKNDFPDFEIDSQEFMSFKYGNTSYILVNGQYQKKYIYTYNSSSDTWELYHEIDLLSFGNLYLPKGVVIGNKLYFQPVDYSPRLFEFDIENKILFQKNDLPDLGQKTQLVAGYEDKLLLASSDGKISLLDITSFDNELIFETGGLYFRNIFIVDDRILIVGDQGVISELLL